MEKRIAHAALALPLIVLIVLFLSGFSKQPITTFDQLAQPGTTIAVGLDTPAEQSLAEDYPSAKLIPYSDKILAYTDVANGRLDAYVGPRREMEFAIMHGFEGVRLLEENYAVNKIAVAISPVSPIPSLTQRLNAFIRQSKADGTLDDMYERWVIRDEETLPDIPPAKNPAFTLRVGTTGTVMPYSYYIGNRRTELIRLYEERRMSSVTDLLTGLLNRRGFMERLEPIWHNLAGATVAFISIDMDRLKHINDNFGHAAGDFAIRLLARAIKAALGKDGVGARIGGDEFLIFLPSAGNGEADAFLAHFDQALDRLNAEEDRSFTVSASAGCTTKRLTELDTIEGCIHDSDTRMYQIKEARHRAR